MSFTTQINRKMWKLNHQRSLQDSRCLGCDASEICCSCQGGGPWLRCSSSTASPPQQGQAGLREVGCAALDPWRDMANQIRIPTDEYPEWHISEALALWPYWKPSSSGSFWNKNGWSLMSFYPEDQLLSHGFFFWFQNSPFWESKINPSNSTQAPGRLKACIRYNHQWIAKHVPPIQ